MNRRAVLTFLLAAVSSIAFADPETLINEQQEAMEIWAAGDFEGAILKFEGMYKRFPSENRGKTALFHAANLLENKRMPFVQSTDEAHAVLVRARDFYSRAAAIPGQSPHLLERAREANARLQTKLNDLSAIKSWRYDFRIASEKLSDFEASRAAAAHLESALAAHPDQSHEILFLILVHQADYIDALSAALADAYARVRDPRPDLFEKAYDWLVPAIDEAANRAIAIGERAVAEHPTSPHRADYHVFLGAAYQSAATAHMARRDHWEQLADAEKMETERQSIIQLLGQAKQQNETIVRLADEYAASASLDAAASNEWSRQKPRALARIVEINQLLFPFQAAQPQPADAQQTLPDTPPR